MYSVRGVIKHPFKSCKTEVEITIQAAGKFETEKARVFLLYIVRKK